MTLEEALTTIINNGIAGAKADYTRPDQKSKLEGSIEGFEACRGKDVAGMIELLTETRRKAQEAFRRVHENEISDDEYWKIRCFESEVEWTANCLSAILVNEGHDPIVPPTARAAINVARIIGVKDEFQP